jgi:hypothetical protein
MAKEPLHWTWTTPVTTSFTTPTHTTLTAPIKKRRKKRRR